MKVTAITDEDVTVEIGHQKVTIEKLFGPTVFADIRIRPEIKTAEWIIERQSIDTMEWREWCRIPGQLEEEFKD